MFRGVAPPRPPFPRGPQWPEQCSASTEEVARQQARRARRRGGRPCSTPYGRRRCVRGRERGRPGGPGAGARGHRPAPVAAGTASGPAGRALALEQFQLRPRRGRPLPGALGPGAGRRGGETGGLTDAPHAACGLQGTTAAQDAFADPTRVSYTGEGIDLGGRDPRGPRLRFQQPHDGPPPPWRPSSDPVAGRRRPPSPPPARPLPGGVRGQLEDGERGRGLAPQEAGEKAGGGGSPQPAGTHCLHTACTLPAEALDPGGGGLAAPARCPEG